VALACRTRRAERDDHRLRRRDRSSSRGAQVAVAALLAATVSDLGALSAFWRSERQHTPLPVCRRVPVSDRRRAPVAPFVILERPAIPLRLASSYSWSRVRPPRPRWERRPPRRPEEVSLVELRLLVWIHRYERAPCSQSSPRSPRPAPLSPPCSRPSLMCSY
jgi:hypothetical protein